MQHQFCLGNAATLNKWIRTRDGLKESGLTCHCLRHSMKDRLRAAQCPDSVQDQVLGHTTKGAGAGYGEGYPLDLLAKWLNGKRPAHPPMIS